MSPIVIVVVYLFGVFTGAYSFNLKVRKGVNSGISSGLRWLRTHNTTYYEQQADKKTKGKNEQ